MTGRHDAMEARRRDLVAAVHDWCDAVDVADHLAGELATLSPRTRAQALGEIAAARLLAGAIAARIDLDPYRPLPAAAAGNTPGEVAA